jgi:hypothetical protein
MVRQLSILILFAVQCLLIVTGKELIGRDGNPFILFVLSLFIAYLYHKTVIKNAAGDTISNPKPIHPFIAFLLGLLPFILLLPFINAMFHEYHDYYKSSDVIPQLDALYTRWQRGEFPYHSLPEYSWRPFPVYMPLHWFPLAVPYAMHMDVRWIGIILLALANGVWAVYVIQKSKHTLTAIFGICMPAIALVFYLGWARFDISITLETIICAYYLILAVGLVSRNIWLTTVGIILCLLSRYVLVFWLPLFAILLWMNKPVKINLAVWGSVLLAVVLIYILPFYAVDTTILKNGVVYHNECAIAEWNADPYGSWTFTAGLYFAPYIKALTSGSMEHRVFIARCIQGAVMLGLCIGGVFSYRKRKDTVNFYDYSLMFLYLTVLLFYMFSPLTYKYYYIVLLMLSAVLCYKTMNQLKTSKDN